jgi:DNA transposition AAA+ family ATPase
VLQDQWPRLGVTLPEGGVRDAAAVAAVVRITGGNFRLLQRLLTQVERLLTINQLATVTGPVVEAARESLVIGTG